MIRTLGVEEEYGLVDPRTRQLVPVAPNVLARAERAMGDAVQNEFKSSQIEMATPVCATLDEIEREIRAARRRLGTAARAEGARLVATGTHPFSSASQQPTTDKERYRGLSDTYRELGRDLVIFGCHVHVGLDDPDLGIAIFDSARWQLVPLLALAPRAIASTTRRTSIGTCDRPRGFRRSSFASPTSAPPSMRRSPSRRSCERSWKRARAKSPAVCLRRRCAPSASASRIGMRRATG